MRQIAPSILIGTLAALVVLCYPAYAQRVIKYARADDPRAYLTDKYSPDPSAIKVARLHYSGGGDWYWGSSAIPNFLDFLSDNTPYPVDTLERQVTITGLPTTFYTRHGDWFTFALMVLLGIHLVRRFVPFHKRPPSLSSRSS